MIENKSDKLSIKYKDEGNKKFLKSQFYQALTLYNKAICYAVSNENLALAYANRSAVFMELRKYEECLNNIELAKENSYPADKLQKLNEREEKCKKLKEAKVIDPEFTPDNFIKLSYPANPKIPFIVDGLECRKTTSGYGIFTTRDLNPGDIISIEPASFVSMNKIAQYSHCSNCIKTAMMNLIPCTKSASLMFCSVECRESVYRKFNNLDHALMEGDIMKPFNPHKLLADVDEVFGGRDKVIDFLKVTDLKNLNKNIFDYDWSAMDELKQKEAFMKCILSFNDDFFLVPIKMDCIRATTNGNRLLNDAGKRLAKIIFKKAVVFEGFDDDLGNIKEGDLLYTFRPFLKHSCQANTDSFFSTTDNVTYVTRHIKTGQELTFNTLDDFTRNQPPVLRREFIKASGGGLSCDCYLCANNISPARMKLDGLDPSIDALFQFTIFQSKSLKFRAWKDIIKQLQANWELIGVYNKHHPKNLSKNIELLVDENRRILQCVAGLLSIPCLRNANDVYIH